MRSCLHLGGVADGQNYEKTNVQTFLNPTVKFTTQRPLIVANIVSALPSIVPSDHSAVSGDTQDVSKRNTVRPRGSMRSQMDHHQTGRLLRVLQPADHTKPTLFRTAICYQQSHTAIGEFYCELYMSIHFSVAAVVIVETAGQSAPSKLAYLSKLRIQASSLTARSNGSPQRTTDFNNTSVLG